MRLVPYEEFVEAIRNANIRVINGQVQVSSLEVVQITWDDAVDFVAFARLALQTITTEEQVLFFHEHGVWPSSENQYLFRLVMKALVNEDIESPSQRYFRFSSGDHEAAMTLLQIGLQSGWGGVLLGGNDNWFYFDHDGFGIIESSVDVAQKLGSLAGLRIIPSTFRSENDKL